jgi:hypothetical protein
VCSLGQNNLPCFCLSPVNSYIKMIHRREQGGCRCKTDGTGLTVLLNSALKCVPRTMAIRGVISSDFHKENGRTSDCHYQEYIVNLRAGCHRPDLASSNPCYLRAGLGKPQYTESGLPRGYSCCGTPRYWSGECSNRVKSSTRHFTSTVPVFSVPDLFDVR